MQDHVLISADMEGIAGVVHGDDVAPGSPGWDRFRHLLTAEVNAVVAGLKAGGIERILVNEAHANMRNIVLEELDPDVVLASGWQKPFGMMHGIEGARGAIFVGYHAGAGELGVLAHTYRARSILGVWLNDEPASEGTLNAALAAEFGVPVLLVAGDDRACADAATYAPAAERVAVKTCISRYAAESLHPQRVGELLAEAAQRAAARADPIPPTQSSPTMTIDLDGTHLADVVALTPTIERTGVRQVRFTSSTMAQAYTTFRIVANIIGAAEEGDWG